MWGWYNISFALVGLRVGLRWFGWLFRLFCDFLGFFLGVLFLLVGVGVVSELWLLRLQVC